MRVYLNAFFSEVERSLLDPSMPVTDIRGVTAKIESLLPSLAKPEQRRPMLTLHYLFCHCMPGAERSKSFERVKRFIPELSTPSSESFFLYVFEGRLPDWSAQSCEALLLAYFRRRYESGHLDVGALLGAAGALTVAELYRTVDETSARRLVSWAVDQFPSIRRLREYEATLATDGFQPILWWKILLPEREIPPPPTTGQSRKLEKLNGRLRGGNRQNVKRVAKRERRRPPG